MSTGERRISSNNSRKHPFFSITGCFKIFKLNLQGLIPWRWLWRWGNVTGLDGKVIQKSLKERGPQVFCLFFLGGDRLRIWNGRLFYKIKDAFLYDWLDSPGGTIRIVCKSFESSLIPLQPVPLNLLGCFKCNSSQVSATRTSDNNTLPGSHGCPQWQHLQ